MVYVLSVKAFRKYPDTVGASPYPTHQECAPLAHDWIKQSTRASANIPDALQKRDSPCTLNALLNRIRSALYCFNLNFTHRLDVPRTSNKSASYHNLPTFPLHGPPRSRLQDVRDI